MKNNGIGIVGLLGIAFVVLKLTGFINWSWWYVTLPFWGGTILWVVAVLVLIVLNISDYINGSKQ